MRWPWSSRVDPSPRFHVPDRRTPLPACTLRALHADDHAACEAIYRLNEPGRFPPGVFPEFSAWLRDGRCAVLAAERDGRLCGFGGIQLRKTAQSHLAWLSFGMVDPACQRQGLGTALLLGRLALLPPAALPCTLAMSNVGGSDSFYRRFGFRFWRKLPSGRLQIPLDVHRALFTAADTARCELALWPAWLAPALRAAPPPGLWRADDGAPGPAGERQEANPAPS